MNTPSPTTKFRRLLIGPALALLALPSHAQDWLNPGEGDWFDPTNWSTAAVPTAADDANINNGGTAVFDEDLGTVTVQNLNVGVDGGEGTLRFQDVGAFGVAAAQGIHVGVTEAGADRSTGTLSFIDTGSSARLLPDNSSVPFLLGVSKGAGAASGRLIESGSNPTIRMGLASTGPFSITQVGVAEGGGAASGDMTARGLQFQELPLLEVGVSRGAGSAQGRVETDQVVTRIEDLNVGVATDAGDADGWVRTSALLRSNTLSGSAQVGVSAGTGRALGVVDLRRTVSSNARSFGPFSQLDIGVSNGAGDASGSVLTGTGLSAQTLNLGIGNSTGMGTGLIRTDHGFSDFDTMNLGPGATVLLNAGSNVRGSETRDDDAYGAINVDTAVLDGTLVVDFDYIPDGPTRFELINSTALDGLDGDFANVEVRNLNPGLSFTSGVVEDGGIAKYVLNLTGAPSLPEWADPGSDDWFDTSNWNTGTVPDFSQPALILNGGEARASAATAPGPLQAFQFGVGVDGGNGSLTVSGVDLETVSNFQAGVIRPDHTGGGSARGSASFADAELRIPGATGTDDEVPAPVPTERVTSIGAAYTTGTAEGSLNLDNANYALGSLFVGYVNIDGADADATAEVEGSLVATDGTQLPSDVRAAQAFVDADGASGAAAAELLITDAVVSGSFSLGEVEADGADSRATASANAVIADTTFNSSWDFSEIEADGDGGIASSTVTASLDRVRMLGESLALTECDAEALGAQVLPSTAIVNVADAELGSADTTVSFSVSEIETDEDGVADCTGRAEFVDSELTLGFFEIAEGDAEDTSTARATAEVTISGGSLTADVIRIGEADPSEDGVAIVDSRLWLVDTAANSSREVIVGFYDDDGAAVGNTITARLGLTSSSLDTPLLVIGVENPANHPLDAEVSLNPSYLRTDDLQLGPTSRIVLTAEGPTRASPTNLGRPGLYAAIDAGTARIDGEIIVDIAYPGMPGDTLDVLSTDPGGLTGSNPQIRFIGAPADAAEFEIVTENGRDVLRFSILRDLTPAAIPINQPLTLLLIMLGLSVLGAAALRRA